VIAESEAYELLPTSHVSVTLEQTLGSIYIIVIFRAKQELLNRELTKRLNATRRVYVSGTQLDGKPATRFAVANWRIDVERELAVVKAVLAEVVG